MIKFAVYLLINLAFLNFLERKNRVPFLWIKIKALCTIQKL